MNDCGGFSAEDYSLPLNARYAYRCRLCGKRFFDSVIPQKMTDPICHYCVTGGQQGPRRVFPEFGGTVAHPREDDE